MNKYVCCFIITLCILPSCASKKDIAKPDLKHAGTVSIISEQKIDTWGKTGFELLDISETKKLAEIITGEMNKYPDDFFDKIGLKFIVLCRNLSFNNQSRAAVPDNYKSTLYISCKDSYSQNYIIHCFHHELNHFTEFFLFNDYYHKLDNWPKGINSSANNKGGVYAYNNPDNDWYSIDMKLNGFLNMYSTLSEEEDRSEIMAFFMNDSSDDFIKMITKVKSDPVLYSKCEILFSLYAEKLQFNWLLNRFKNMCY